MNIPTYLPHVPEQFDGTLILGESTFKGQDFSTQTGWDSWFDEGYPKEFIRKHVEDNKDTDLNTFRRLRESFEPVLIADDFWARKAFTNFIPELLVNSKSRPTTAQWTSGQNEFEAILDMVQPQRILVVGWELWKKLPPGEDEQEDRCTYRATVLAMCIPHPSFWNRIKPKYTVDDARRVTAILMSHSGTPNMCKA